MKVSRILGSMSGEDFDRAAARFPRMTQRARDVARALLVDGKSFDEVQEAYGVASRQLAHQWASKVAEGHWPDDWVTASVTLPRDDMNRVMEIVAAARESLFNMTPRKPDK